MKSSFHKLVFESTADEPFRVMVEPEAFEWTLRQGDTFEVLWSEPASESPVVVWHGKNCVAVIPPGPYELLLNGRDAFDQLQPDPIPAP